MNSEQIKLQGDYLKLLENLECDINNISISLKPEHCIRDFDDELIKAIKKLKQSSDVEHQKSIHYEILMEKNEYLAEVCIKALQLFIDEFKLYCKEIEQKIEDCDK